MIGWTAISYSKRFIKLLKQSNTVDTEEPQVTNIKKSDTVNIEAEIKQKNKLENAQPF